MKTFRLKGIAEGLAGVSYVNASSVEEVFAKFPLMNLAKDKITINGLSFEGSVPCDG